MTPRHPFQPVLVANDDIIRFKPNAIVAHLLDHGGIDLNAIAIMDFPDEDRTQFAQLIGYSVSGFGDLDYVSDRDFETAELLQDALLSPAGLPASVDDLPTDLFGAIQHVRKLLPDAFANSIPVSQDGLMGIGHYLDAMIAREFHHRHHAGDAATH